jgi:hypothetical protein
MMGNQLKSRRPYDLAEFKRLARAWYLAGRYRIAPLEQRRHGERGNIVTETWLFHPNMVATQFSRKRLRDRKL